MHPKNIQASTHCETIGGQEAVGKGISQPQTVEAARPEVTQIELVALWRILTELKAQVGREAPPEKQAAALERIDELAEAIAEEEPDLTTMEYVKNWLVKHLPGLAGAVTGVVVHPIVGKLVEAAGDTLADEFHRRFGQG